MAIGGTFCVAIRGWMIGGNAYIQLKIMTRIIMSRKIGFHESATVNNHNLENGTNMDRSALMSDSILM